MKQKICISVIIPVFNEMENLKTLHSRLVRELNKINSSYEIIFTDDGSGDGSDKVLRRISKKDNHTTVIIFDKNYGKIAALEAGIRQSRGEILVFLDSDLQHDPGEIPIFLDEIYNGYDVVVGYRNRRQDSIHRIIYSIIINQIIYRLTAFRSKDLFSGFKCYRRKLVKDLGLYGDMFRFVAYIANKNGYRVTEVPISNHCREYGKSQSGYKLIKRAIQDILVILFSFKTTQKAKYKIKYMKRST